MKIELTLDQSDMDLLRTGQQVAKSIRGGLVVISFDPTIHVIEYLEKKHAEKK